MQLQRSMHVFVTVREKEEYSWGVSGRGLTHLPGSLSTVYKYMKTLRVHILSQLRWQLLLFLSLCDHIASNIRKHMCVNYKTPSFKVNVYISSFFIFFPQCFKGQLAVKSKNTEKKKKKKK